MKARLGAWLRKWADRIDDAGAPKRTAFSFTFESGPGGMKFRTDGAGCPLWYVGAADYRRAHTEADTEHAVVDWAALADYRPGRATVSYQGGRR